MVRVYCEIRLPRFLILGSFTQGFIICGLSLLFVLALLRVFFSGSSGVPPSTKTNTPNSNSTRIEDSRENQLRLMWLSSLFVLVWQFFVDYVYVLCTNSSV